MGGTGRTDRRTFARILEKRCTCHTVHTWSESVSTLDSRLHNTAMELLPSPTCSSPKFPQSVSQFRNKIDEWRVTESINIFSSFFSERDFFPFLSFPSLPSKAPKSIPPPQPNLEAVLINKNDEPAQHPKHGTFLAGMGKWAGLPSSTGALT